MKRSLSVLGITLCLVCLLSAGCSKSPEQKREAYLTSAQAYLDQEKYAEAAIQFQNALQIAPDDAATLLALGEVQLRQEKVREAFSAFSRAVKAAPDNLTAREHLAGLLMLGREYEQALGHARFILEKDPSNRKAREILSQALFLSGEKDEALSIMEGLLAQPDPGEGTLINAIQMYLSSGNLTKALGLVDRGAALYPRSSRIRFLASDIYASQKDIKSATRWAQEAYAIAGDDIVAGLALGRFYAGHNMTELFDGHMLELNAKFPDDARPCLLEAGVRLSQGALDKALLCVHKAREREDSSPAKHLESQILLRQGKSEEAKGLLGKTLEGDPQALPSRLLLSQILLNEGDAPQVLELLAEPLASQADRPEIASLAASAYLMQGEVTKAQELVEASLAKHPGNLKIHALQAKIHFGKREYAGALKEVEGFPAQKTPELLYIGAVSAVHEGVTDKAQIYVQSLRELNPEAWPTLHAEILLALSRKTPKEALRLTEKALELKADNTEALRIYAGIAPQIVGADKAIAKVSALCDKAPSAVCHMLLSGLYERAGRRDEALKSIKAAIDHAPDNAASYHALAAYYLRNDMSAKALKEYERILNENPDDLQAAIMLALIYQGLDKTIEATKIYEYILKREPSQALAANNLAWILAESGSSDELNRALQLAQKAKDAFPDDPRIADTLGYVYLKKGLADNAASQFSLALERLPDEPEINYHMALAMVDQERKAQAIPYLKKALEKDFGNKAAAQELLTDIEQGGS